MPVLPAIILPQASSESASLQTSTVPRVTERSLELRNKIVKDYVAGKGYGKISMQLSVPVSSVQSIIKKWKEQSAATNRPRMGSPRKIIPHAIGKLKRRVKIYLRTSRNESVE